MPKLSEPYEWMLLHEMAPIDKETVNDFFIELKEQATVHLFYSEEDDKQMRRQVHLFLLVATS